MTPSPAHPLAQSQPRRRVPYMPRAAFTIIELLIAMAILIALTAIVVPFSGARVRHALRGEASEQIEAAIWSARATAQRSNAPVRIVAVRTDRGTSIVAEQTQPGTVGSQDDSCSRLPLADLGDIHIHGAEPAADNAPSRESAERETSLTLATVLPDGAAVVAAGLSLVDRAGDMVDLRIDPVALSVTATPAADSETDSTDEQPPLDEAP